MELFGTRIAATLAPQGDHRNFYMKNKYAALAAHMLKAWIVIYDLDSVNPLYDSKCEGLSQAKFKGKARKWSSQVANAIYDGTGSRFKQCYKAGSGLVQGDGNIIHLLYDKDFHQLIKPIPEEKCCAQYCTSQLQPTKSATSSKRGAQGSKQIPLREGPTPAKPPAKPGCKGNNPPHMSKKT